MIRVSIKHKIAPDLYLTLAVQVIFGIGCVGHLQLKLKIPHRAYWVRLWLGIGLGIWLVRIRVRVRPKKMNLSRLRHLHNFG